MKQRISAGFTLLEALIVVAIGIVVTAMAVPMTVNAMRTYQMNAAVTAVTATIESTRYAAIMHGYPYGVTFAPGSNTYQVLTQIPPATALSAVVQTGNTQTPTVPIPISGSGNILINQATYQPVTYEFFAGGTVTELTGNTALIITNPYGEMDTITVTGVGNVSVQRQFSATTP